MSQPVTRYWSQGRTLLTDITRRWSKETWDRNEQEERRRIFESFLDEDQGRSRRLIATCESAEDAERIVKAVSDYDALARQAVEMAKIAQRNIRFVLTALWEEVLSEKDLEQKIQDDAEYQQAQALIAQRGGT